jgi:hypothetical protein
MSSSLVFIVNPFTQVGRSSFLCKVLLRDEGYDTKVRSIIATCGKLPAKRGDQYVKVLRPDELTGYITWFKDPPLEKDHFEEAKRLLGLWVADYDSESGFVDSRRSSNDDIPF